MYDPTKPYKNKILKLIESTWNTPYVKIYRGLYPIIEKKFNYPEVQHTDGIGTKGIYHWQKRTFCDAIIDALAMNLNDLAMVGAIPYALQNHVILPRDDHKAILIIVGKLCRECRKRNIAMTGGEISIHNDIAGLDISITVSGFIKSVWKNRCKKGDILIGLRSSGLHSNGITKVREVFKDKYRKEFTIPTVIYSETILSLLSKYTIHGMMHITGGAFTKLKDILDDNLNIVISHQNKLQPQKIFYIMHQKGISNEAMYSTFNCGIGFILSVPKTEAKKIISQIAYSDIIGEVVPGNGLIVIRSAFNNKVFTI